MLRTLSSFFPLREDPADAEVVSHKLPVRAGYIRRTAPVSTRGFLWPASVKRGSAIVREEMDCIGAQEAHLPALLPAEPAKATDRWMNMVHPVSQDRKGGDHLFGPTHEDVHLSG